MLSLLILTDKTDESANANASPASIVTVMLALNIYCLDFPHRTFKNTALNMTL